MDRAKILKIAGIYAKHFNELGVVEQVQIPEDEQEGKVFTYTDQHSHAYWMLTKIDEFVNADKLEKAQRWLGFIQGILFSTGQFSIAEMRSHNR